MEIEPTESKQNLRQKLASIRRAIHNVEKRGHNEFHRYDYAMASDVAGLLGTAMAEANILVARQNLTITRSVENLSEDKGKAEVVVGVQCQYVILDGDSDEKIVVDAYGEGRDRGDKAAYKAFTGALKYFLIQTFMLATGDDPEDSAKDDEARTRAPKPSPNAPPPKPPAAPPAPSAVVSEQHRKALWASCKARAKQLGKEDAAAHSWLEQEMLNVGVPPGPDGHPTSGAMLTHQYQKLIAAVGTAEM